MNLLLGFLLFLNAYILVVFLLHRSGKLDSERFHLAGPLLMWRTQVGKRAIDRLSRTRRLWHVFGDVGIAATWFMGLAVFAMLVFQLYAFFSRPAEMAQNSPPVQYLIGLPGVNPLIPVGYGIAGLVIALVIHEGAHGVLARAHDLKVKSLGLLFFIVPIGAFVEPDEKDLERASPRARNRVFAAGPMSNLVLVLLAGLVFSQAFMGSVAIANDGQGIGLASVTPDSAASEGGLLSGDILVELDGRPITTVAGFNTVMEQTRAGERVSLRYWRDGELLTGATTLDDKGEYLADLRERNPSVPQRWVEENRTKGFLGVSAVALQRESGTGLLPVETLRDVLADPLSNGVAGFLLYISYPFVILQGVDLFQEPFRSFIVLEGPLASLGPYWFFLGANMLYWLMWLNLMLGTFNALPAGPLDGGQMFRTTLRAWLMRFYKVDESKVIVREDAGVPGLEVTGADEETQDKLYRVNRTLKRTTWTLGLFILSLILLPIFGPGIVGLFL